MRPRGQLASANSPLAMLVKTVSPLTRTSAGATVAVWASTTRALSGPIVRGGLGEGVHDRVAVDLRGQVQDEVGARSARRP